MYIAIKRSTPYRLTGAYFTSCNCNSATWPKWTPHALAGLTIYNQSSHYRSHDADNRRANNTFAFASLVQSRSSSPLPPSSNSQGPPGCVDARGAASTLLSCAQYSQQSPICTRKLCEIEIPSMACYYRPCDLPGYSRPVTLYPEEWELTI